MCFFRGDLIGDNPSFVDELEIKGVAAELLGQIFLIVREFLASFVR